MSARRAFAKNGLAGAAPGAPFQLEAAVSHRLRVVLRLKDGAAIEVFDDDGRVVRGALVGDTVVVDDVATVDDALPPLVVLQAVSKADKLELVAQKATELGASCLVVFQARRCQLHLGGKSHDDDRARAKVERLARIASDAARQCGRARPPAVYGPDRFADALARVRDLVAAGGIAVVGVIDAPVTLSGALAEHGARLRRGLAIVVGPEGGLDDDEVARLIDAGAVAVRWSRFVLRTETAALSALALTQAALGEA